MKCAPGVDPRSVLPVAEKGSILLASCAASAWCSEPYSGNRRAARAPRCGDLTLGIPFEEAEDGVSRVPTTRPSRRTRWCAAGRRSTSATSPYYSQRRRNRGPTDSMRGYYRRCLPVPSARLAPRSTRIGGPDREVDPEAAPRPTVWADKEDLLRSMVALVGYHCPRAPVRRCNAGRRMCLATTTDRQGNVRRAFEQARARERVAARRWPDIPRRLASRRSGWAPLLASNRHRAQTRRSTDLLSRGRPDERRGCGWLARPWSRPLVRLPRSSRYSSLTVPTSTSRGILTSRPLACSRAPQGRHVCQAASLEGSATLASRHRIASRRCTRRRAADNVEMVRLLPGRGRER